MRHLGTWLRPSVSLQTSPQLHTTGATILPASHQPCATAPTVATRLRDEEIPCHMPNFLYSGLMRDSSLLSAFSSS